MNTFRVGVDTYSLIPLGLSPFEILDWVAAHGGDGVQFSGLDLKEGQKPDRAFLNDLAQSAAEKNLYLEWGGGQHIPFDMQSWAPKDIYDANRKVAEQANTLGVDVIRSCSGGLMRWQADAPSTETFIAEMARALREQKSMLTDLGVVLALELHFEFTTFELLRLFDMIGADPGGCFGICLDTMNTLTMLEDPLSATERVLPWVVATHVKDGGLLLEETGLVSFTAEAGTGHVDLAGIFARLMTLDRPVNLSLEDHGGSFEIPVFDPTFLERFPDLTVPELVRLVQLARTGNEAARSSGPAPLDRADWPRLCEERVIRGMQGIRRIAESVTA